jgi:phosphoglycolate phosphatase
MNVLFGNTIIDCSAIAFDKDGTLIDRNAFWRSLYDVRVRVMKEQLDLETVTYWSALNGVQDDGEVIDPGGPLALGSFEEEKVVLALAIYKVEQVSWGKALEQAKHLFRLADERLHVGDYLEPLPGMPETLHKLAQYGLPMCILTSDVRNRVLEMLQLFDLQGAIRTIVTPDDVSEGKPAPEMVNKAAELLNLSPEGIVVVGDTPMDFQMAKAAGAYCVAISTHSDQEGLDLADSTIESVADISIP